MHYFGNIELSIFEAEFGKLQTNEVFLTDACEIHIKEHHPEDYSLLLEYGMSIINNPDIILCDNKNVGTVLLIRRLPETNLNLVLRLALETDIKGRKNSIMTFYRVRESNLNKLLNRNKILYKK